MAIETTDATFEQDVLDISTTRPVVIDLWAPWCGPCRTLGPIIEKVVEETNGEVELAKVNVDENPKIAATFQVQSIPAVYAIKDRSVVDGFIGALGEPAVREFVGRLTGEPSETEQLVEAGDEESLRRALEIEPDNAAAIVALAQLLVDRGEDNAALEFLGRIPETPETRHVAAQARLALAGTPVVTDDGLDQRLDALLESVRDDEAARVEFLDLLESMDPEDPRRATYRRALSSKLF